MNKCKHCGREFYREHYCPTTNTFYNEDDVDSIMETVMAVEVATDIISATFEVASLFDSDSSSSSIDFSSGSGDFGGGGASSDF